MSPPMSPILRRLLSLILSLAVASAVIFAVVDLVPGDPASFMLGTGAQPDTVAALRGLARYAVGRDH